MNRLIESIFDGFSVGGINIPISYMYYMGHGEPYIVYMGVWVDNVLRGDDSLIAYGDYYDFDVYAKGNYKEIVEAVITLLEQNGFVWKPEKSGRDMYDPDTGYYHKTINFIYLREE